MYFWQGTHNYYCCLLDLVDVAPLVAIEDVARTKDDVWKQLLHRERVPSAADRPALADIGDVLAIEADAPDLGPDEHVDEVVEAVVGGAGRGRAVARGRGRGGRGVPRIVPAAPHVAVEFGPLTFKFPCGDVQIEIKLDGFSHTSGIRRAYAKCPRHADCFKYTQLNIWPHPWMGLAHVLLYMRAGQCAGCETKMDHRFLLDPSHDEILAIEGEMPDMLKAPGFPVDLHAVG